VQDILALTVVNARGEVVRCSRHENPRLFRLVAGGYGLFGIVYSVRLQLARRHRLQRSVQIVRADAVIDTLTARRDSGCTYGDWQFAIDSHSADFLDLGILSAYAPCAPHTPAPASIQLGEADWRRLLLLAHTDKTRAFAEYTHHYLRTDGQTYWSDEHQFGTYVEGYHTEIDAALGATVPGSEMITELFVPRARLAAFLADARRELRARRADVIYGTVRLIERDTDTFLAWAREPWACIIFNLHVDHHPRGLARRRDQFRALIDCALACGGTYYLTYPRLGHARADPRRPPAPARLPRRAAPPRSRRLFPERLVAPPHEAAWRRHHLRSGVISERVRRTSRQP
jgi:FAD/FMN-containing dehydrogenase